MSLKDLCRACLRPGQTKLSPLDSIVPKSCSPPKSVGAMCKIFIEKLKATKKSLPDKICTNCLCEIYRTYSFMRKCDKSEDALKKIQNVKIRLKRLEIVSHLSEPSSWKTGQFGSNMHVLEIKNETIEEREYGTDDPEREQFPATKLANVSGQEEPKSQQTFAEHGSDNLEIKTLDHLAHERDVPMNEISVIQDIKQEPELDLSAEQSEFETEDQSCTEIVTCPSPSCRFGCTTIESLQKHIFDKHMQGKTCKLCSQEFETSTLEHCSEHLRESANQRQKAMDNAEGSPFKCELCLKIFLHKRSLSQHLQQHSEKSFKCEICSKTFLHEVNLLYDIQQHTGEPQFKCELCPKAFTEKGRLTDHIRLHTRHFKCKSCLKTFARNREFTEHLRLHTGERPFKCDTCSRTFTRKSDLQKHLPLHTGQRPFKCEICSKTFLRKEYLWNHLQIHSGERPLKCEICSKTFIRKKNLTKHLKCHSIERPFKCEICPKTYKIKELLNQHLTFHTGERPFKCEICSKTFPHKAALSKHSRKHSIVGSIKCENCSETFLSKTGLKKHLPLHAFKNGSFKCEICSKKFQEEKLFSNHLRRHSEKKPFKCEICSKAFPRKCKLMDHLRTHTGERPFKCGTCPSSFTRKSSLTSHLRRENHTEK